MTAQPEPGADHRDSIPYDPQAPAGYFRQLAKTYRDDAFRFRQMPPRQHHNGFSSEQWAIVYEQISRELLHVAHLIDGGDR